MTGRTVFISYAHEDRDEVFSSVDLLRAGGVKVFYDVAGIDPGEDWKAALYKALANCERVLVFWSEASAASEWVQREWRYALQLGKKIVPTLLDLTPLPVELAAFQAVGRLRKPAAPKSAPQVNPSVRARVWAWLEDAVSDVLLAAFLLVVGCGLFVLTARLFFWGGAPLGTGHDPISLPLPAPGGWDDRFFKYLQDVSREVWGFIRTAYESLGAMTTVGGLLLFAAVAIRVFRSAVGRSGATDVSDASHAAQEFVEQVFAA